MKKKSILITSKTINFIKLTETRKVISKDLPKNTNKIEKLSKDYLFEILKSVKSFANENGSELFFVYLPEYADFKYNSENTLSPNKTVPFRTQYSINRHPC